MSTFPCFSTIFTKGNNFCDFLFAFLMLKPVLHWGLLIEERIRELILSNKSGPLLRRETKMKMAGLLPLKMYLCTQRCFTTLKGNYDMNHQPG